MVEEEAASGIVSSVGGEEGLVVMDGFGAASGGEGMDWEPEARGDVAVADVALAGWGLVGRDVALAMACAAADCATARPEAVARARMEDRAEGGAEMVVEPPEQVGQGRPRGVSGCAVDVTANEGGPDKGGDVLLAWARPVLSGWPPLGGLEGETLLPVSMDGQESMRGAVMACKAPICCPTPCEPSHLPSVHFMPHIVPEVPPVHCEAAALAVAWRMGMIWLWTKGASLEVAASQRMR